MALNHSPKIVTDGLVFAYDMANTQKSWKGMPTTNQFTLPTGDTNGFGVQNSTFTRVRTGNYGGYEIKPTDYVWRYNVTGNDCPYHGWDIPTTSGAVVTFSFDYYVDPSTTNYPVTNYLANFENAGSGVGGSIADPTPSIKGVWKRAYFSSTATATGNSRCLLYPGACGGRLGDAGFILYKNPQVEFNAPGSIPTPFVAGTRSNTQTLIDLTGTNTITASSLTYASDGTFSFNGSNSIITIPNSTTTNIVGSITLESWVKFSQLAGSDNQIIGKYSNSGGASTQGWILFRSTADYTTYGPGNTGPNINEISWLATSSGVFNGALIGSGQQVQLNTWQCIHAIYNNSNDVMQIYINGVLTRSVVRTGQTAGVLESVSNRVSVGGNYEDNNRYANGSISNTKIYNRALSAAEVKQNFNALRGRYGI